MPALGARIGNQYLGTFGTFGAFSTQADKSLNTGEGGFLLTNDTLLFERAVLLSGAYETRVHKHCTWPLSIREQSLPLFNFRMDELRGALGQVQLEKLPLRISTLAPMLGDQDLEDLEQALAKVLNHRMSKQAVIEEASREGLAA